MCHARLVCCFGPVVSSTVSEPVTWRSDNVKTIAAQACWRVSRKRISIYVTLAGMHADMLHVGNMRVHKLAGSSMLEAAGVPGHGIAVLGQHC
jgi:hypothetical protein